MHRLLSELTLTPSWTRKSSTRWQKGTCEIRWLDLTNPSGSCTICRQHWPSGLLPNLLNGWIRHCRMSQRLSGGMDWKRSENINIANHKFLKKFSSKAQHRIDLLKKAFQNKLTMLTSLMWGLNWKWLLLEAKKTWSSEPSLVWNLRKFEKWGKTDNFDQGLTSYEKLDCDERT